jgi:hypothetical protein
MRLPLSPHPISQLISGFNDDVTVILLFGVSFKGDGTTVIDEAATI